ncbi:hypothetical protein K7472_02860 [Streptomyces sp. PTM05]|uniref:Lipoprotein n=1 Tax=Streptantibioticus parmotrematis TaxID=2873249 RepID=A0ABS7QKW4_9ACTN|nr:hypothetical protein [Streptantibioticus parmotrematis]MBY8883780.1 hypothetical protein [Streptantibioticus parmotrematis]
MKHASAIRRIVAATAVVAALGTVSACGGDAKAGHATGTGTATSQARNAASTDDLTALRQVVKATGDAHSAKVEGDITMGSAASMSADGKLDWAHGLTGDMTMSHIGGAVSTAVPGSMSVRYLPDAAYADLGAAAAAQLDGRHWVKYTYADLSKLVGAGAGSDMQQLMRNDDPVHNVQLLLASGTLHRVGTETVRGVSATHYEGTENTAGLATAPGLTAAQRQQLQQQLKQAGVTSGTVDLWVDAHNLPVKVATRMQTSQGTVSSTLYYSDYGVAVSETAPPASDTADLTALLKEAQGSSS